MKRYRVAVKNAKENRIELTFSDLCVKYTNGFSPVLKIKEGEEVPLSVCDPEDVRKSWLVGSLKGYLENKWIEEILEDNIVKEQVTAVSQFITEQMAMAPKPNLIKPEVIQKQQEISSLPQTNLPEAAKVVLEAQPISAPQVEAITDLALVKTYDDFNRLSHFLKLRFIKESSDIDLLRQIQSLTTSSQFKNNIALRLSTLKI
jgi:hypothetical protein